MPLHPETATRVRRIRTSPKNSPFFIWQGFIGLPVLRAEGQSLPGRFNARSVPYQVICFQSLNMATPARKVYFLPHPDSPACKKIPQREISSLRFRRSETAFVHLRLEHLRLKTFEIRAPIYLL